MSAAPSRPRRRAGRRARALAVVPAVLGLLGACSALPPLPDPVPSSLEPSVAASLPADIGNLSPDGFDDAQRMSVRIRNVGCGKLSTGSGFAIDDHTLVTNRHVVADSAGIQVSTYDGRDIATEGTSTATLADLALVRTADALPAASALADADPEPGTQITVVGYPEGRALSVTRGEVLDTVDDPLGENVGKVLVTNAQVEPGSSGSAVLDEDGRIVGVVYAKGDNGTSFVVPVSTLRAMLDDEAGFAPAPTCSN